MMMKPPPNTTPETPCTVCGQRRDQHYPSYGYACPIRTQYGKHADLRGGRQFQAPVPTPTPAPRVFSPGDMVQRKSGGPLGIVTKPSNLMPERQSWVHFVGAGTAQPMMHFKLDIVHGTVHVTERL